MLSTASVGEIEQKADLFTVKNLTCASQDLKYRIRIFYICQSYVERSIRPARCRSG